MKKKYFIFFLFLIILLVSISICVIVFSNTKDNKIEDKIKEEISYIETKILGMLNALNNIPFSNSVLLEKKANSNSASSSQDSKTEGQGSGGETSEEGSSSSDKNSKSTYYTKYSIQNENILINNREEIDWNYMKNTAEILYSSWPTIIIDLHSINIKNEDILTFSNNLDLLIINVQNENKKATLNTLAILYSYLPIYIKSFEEDTDKINIQYTKSHIINSYVLLEEDKWEDMQTEITKAKEYFNLIMNSVKENSNKSNISKIYVLLNEMNNVIKLKEKNLYYLKYKDIMESALNV